MNIVLDENVSLGLAEKLRSCGHNVISIAEDTNRGFADDEIFVLCKKTKSTLITRDYHFTNPIRFPTEGTEGIIYIRHGNLSSKEEIKLVEQFLTEYQIENITGKLVLLAKENIKLR
jgi:predicted nuclease of predicted toxin-antitoxin system